MKSLKLSTFAAVYILLSFCSYGQVDSERLFKSFRQGERTNCASIALIKASLEVYGLNNLFRIDSADVNAMRVTLKDNSTLLLSKLELSSAAQSAGFVLIDSTQESRDILRYAVLTYGIMAKHKQNIEDYKTYEEALEELEYGADASEVYTYLGFKKGKQVVRHRRFTGGYLCGLIAWSPAHAVYACNGYMDYHGRKKPLWAKYSGRLQVIK